jgi:hypothetical protein
MVPRPIISSSLSQNDRRQCPPLTDRWTTTFPSLCGPIKGLGPPLKNTAPHTPSPFDSIRLKAPLDKAHRTPAPISTARPLGPPLKNTAPHTPSPFDSLRLKAPLDKAHRTPAPISTARPTPVTLRQAVASNGFPYVPSSFQILIAD